MRISVCGLLTLMKAHVLKAQQRLQQGKLQDMRETVLAAESMFKRFVRQQTDGIYVVLFYAGSQRPTIWSQLQNFSRSVRAHGAVAF
mmetsp:Transcript_69726/g.225463  ORF Transcript_69726/g.225463 Transcript_69726/m.225463 type:complete len:87 (-) Transcript_69726:37-297(-)